LPKLRVIAITGVGQHRLAAELPSQQMIDQLERQLDLGFFRTFGATEPAQSLSTEMNHPFEPIWVSQLLQQLVPVFGISSC